MDLVKTIFPEHSKTEYIQYLKKEEYESYYSTKNKYPYIVIERLGMNTGNPDPGYEKVNRQEIDDPFRPDPAVKEDDTFTEKDYAIMMAYGLSPGHNAPAGHHHTRPDIWDSTFLYSNICPQEMTFNSGIWVLLENWCKYISKKQKNLNFTNLRIITGSIPDTTTTALKFGADTLNVNIPTHMFKIVTARSKAPENSNKLFIGCFLYPNRPLDPMKPENRELYNWLVPLPKLQELCKYNFETIFTKYYGYDSSKFELINIHELVPVSFTLNPSFETQMLKAQWYGIIIYSKDLDALELNWKLLSEQSPIKDEDLKYHYDFYLLVKDKFNSYIANINNNTTLTEITPSNTTLSNTTLSNTTLSNTTASIPSNTNTSTNAITYNNNGNNNNDNNGNNNGNDNNNNNDNNNGNNNNNNNYNNTTSKKGGNITKKLKLHVSNSNYKKRKLRSVKARYTKTKKINNK
jgi:DNA/RNA endonuclease G (NUC1)